MLGIVMSAGWPDPTSLLVLIAIEIVIFGLAVWRLRKGRND